MLSITIKEEEADLEAVALVKDEAVVEIITTKKNSSQLNFSKTRMADDVAGEEVAVDIVPTSTIITASVYLNYIATYYANICPNLESLVQGAVRGMMASSPIAAAATLRLFFHDCFITGCDASLLIQNPNNDDEQHSSETMFLRADGYKTIAAAKAAVDADPQCANKVSCADIMALAARDAVSLSGGPTWKVELGRYDALGARASDVDLPLTTEDVPALMKRFSAHGLTVDDLVALSGGHTLGATSCVFVNSRIYPTVDAFLDPSFASQLQGICPSNLDPNTFVFFDQSVTSFDNNYFLMVQQKKGVLFSDSALCFDSSSKGIVDKFAVDQNAFFTQFMSSMVRLGRLGLKTAATGEIRATCTKPN
ncbi:hypothetical protein LUZ63_016431 [Rhynchospora breviuscula]|uniref:Peroxidase n=1 Tax=Rhynchospora breviuscula TaxID=2022672 RepID=A0A9P9ZBK0_9POAL|nr:hypothetical protein LUZ63_016431 [Rhynchospora breviuscula]